MGDAVLVSVEDSIATLTLNRPEAFNAFNAPLMAAFAETVREVAPDDAVRGIVITGAGKAFCAGGDLKGLLDAPHGSGPAFYHLAGMFHDVVLTLRRVAKPVVAAVNGAAAGGGFSLALAADFRVMGESAKMKCAYRSAALTLDGGGSWTLPRLVGQARALEIATLDAPITAHQALEWGLANRVVADGAVLTTAQALCGELADGSLHAYGWAKRLIAQSFDTGLEKQLEDERVGISTCGAHPDGQEGMRAFAEKRAPKFK
jgi:2-(1,2-epoxy-1,2-dihydrophenyl)acetyl-CoA isomerase